SGISGLSAGLYAGRYRMKALIVGGDFGGEGTTAGETSNYPGFFKIDGYELMKKVREQVEAVGVPIVEERVSRVERKGHCFMVSAGEETYVTNTILLAVGSKRRTLGLPRENELKGRGVHYCITCDGPLYRNKVVAVVGGGDASVKGINLIAEYVRKVFFVVSGREITAEPINLEQMQKLGDKVTPLLETEAVELIGSDHLEKVRLSKPHHGATELPLDGLFVEIGALPDTERARELGVALDERGYIKTDSMMRTNVDGVFAAGDAVNHFGHFKQYVTAAALGAVAATAAYEDHKIHGDLCQLHALPGRLAAKMHSLK
ncbi:MAG: FAD-dependent oxidoreductase, partial [Parcubacteria group bacterium]|nr:FAD-dependent oxidoreductase [Parcubacteria group bacterium]